jgi:hypothetical protein
MLASWVSQASFKPIGISIAVAKDRAIESLMQVGDKFVLNVLEEGKYQKLMKHFLKRFALGADRFEGVKTQPTENGAPILGDALAYSDRSWDDKSGRWLVVCNYIYRLSTFKRQQFDEYSCAKSGASCSLNR